MHIFRRPYPDVCRGCGGPSGHGLAAEAGFARAEVVDAGAGFFRLYRLDG